MHFHLLALSSFVAFVASTPALVKRASLTYSPAGSEKNNWKTLGCYNDLYPNGRAFSAAYQDNPSGGTTIAKCLSFCSSQGTYLAGIEDGYQCFCGPSLNSGSSATQAAPLSDAKNGGCSIACRGNATQSCGGDNRLIVFQSTTHGPPKRVNVANQAYKGCYQDNQNSRLLPYVYQGDSNPNMTPALCASGCNNRGYDLSGVEFRYQCFCGSSKTVNLGTALSEGSCDNSCTGDLTALCGGAGKLNVYQSTGMAPPPSNPVVVSSVTTSNNRVYKYQACYSDRSSADGRALVGQSRSDPANTIESCVAYCSSYTYAGAEYGTECYCSNSIASFSKPGATCNMGCAGNGTELCGGGYALQLYKLS